MYWKVGWNEAQTKWPSASQMGSLNVCVGVCARVCVYAKVLITGLYKQVNWREKSNKVPCSSFNIPTTSGLHAALTNVCVTVCVHVHWVLNVCAHTVRVVCACVLACLHKHISVCVCEVLEKGFLSDKQTVSSIM